jgi:hypothetical protein
MLDLVAKLLAQLHKIFSQGKAFLTRKVFGLRERQSVWRTRFGRVRRALFFGLPFRFRFHFASNAARAITSR